MSRRVLPPRESATSFSTQRNSLDGSGFAQARARPSREAWKAPSSALRMPPAPSPHPLVWCPDQPRNFSRGEVTSRGAPPNAPLDAVSAVSSLPTPWSSYRCVGSRSGQRERWIGVVLSSRNRPAAQESAAAFSTSQRGMPSGHSRTVSDRHGQRVRRKRRVRPEQTCNVTASSERGPTSDEERSKDARCDGEVEAAAAGSPPCWEHAGRP